MNPNSGIPSNTKTPTVSKSVSFELAQIEKVFPGISIVSEKTAINLLNFMNLLHVFWGGGSSNNFPSSNQKPKMTNLVSYLMHMDMKFDRIVAEKFINLCLADRNYEQDGIIFTQVSKALQKLAKNSERSIPINELQNYSASNLSNMDEHYRLEIEEVLNQLNGIIMCKFSGDITEDEYEIFTFLSAKQEGEIRAKYNLLLSKDQQNQENYSSFLGQDGFGTVYVGINRTKNEYCAIKIVDKSSKHKKALEISANEAIIQHKLTEKYNNKFGNEHQTNLLKIYDKKERRDIDGNLTEIYMVFPLATLYNGSQLHTNLNSLSLDNQKGNIRRLLSIEIARSILIGLAHMHKMNIYHLGLKRSNFLITDKFEVWISDFGLSQEIKENPPMTSESNIQYSRSKSYVGKEDEASLSSANTGSVDASKVDLCLAGIIFWEFITGEIFNITGDISKDIDKALQRKEFIAPYRESLEDLTKKLLSSDLENCITLDEALNHPSITEDSKTTLVEIKDYIKRFVQSVQEKNRDNKPYSVENSSKLNLQSEESVFDTQKNFLDLHSSLNNGEASKVEKIITLVLNSKELSIAKKVEILLCKNEDGVTGFQMALMQNKWQSAEIFLTLVLDHEELFIDDKVELISVDNSKCNLANIYNEAIKGFIYFIINNEQILIARKIKLLSLENGCGIPGLHQLLAHGRKVMVKKFMRLILSSKTLSIAKKVEVLSCKNKDGVSGLQMALKQDKWQSAEVFLTLVLDDEELFIDDKVELISVSNSKCNLANIYNEAIKGFIYFIINNEQILIARKIKLLSLENGCGIPGLHQLLAHGRKVMVKKFMRLILSSKTLSTAKKVEVLLSKNVDNISGLQMALSKNKWKTVQTFLTLIFENNDLFIDDKAELMQISSTDLEQINNDAKNNFIMFIHENLQLSTKQKNKLLK